VLYCAVQNTVRSLKERACAAFGVELDAVEIWDFWHQGKYANLELELDSTLEAARIMEKQAILLDDKVCVGGEGGFLASSPP
jgi:hypothetical protein